MADLEDREEEAEGQVSKTHANGLDKGAQDRLPEHSRCQKGSCLDELSVLFI